MNTINRKRIRFQAPDSAKADALWSHPLAQAAGSAPETEERTFIYYDTPEGALYRNQVKLTADKKERGWEQSLTDLQEDRRIFFLLDNPELDVERFQRTGLGRKLVLDKKQWAAMAPLTTVSCTVTTSTLSFPDGDRIQIIREQGSYQERGASQAVPFDEVILELEEGSLNRLYQVGLAVMYALDAGMTCGGPVQRTLFRVAPGILKPVQEEALSLSAAFTTEAGFNHIVRRLLESLRLNHCLAAHGQGVSQYEGLFALHTALGRLRVIFTLYQAILPKEIVEEVEGELLWLSEALAPAIEWERFMSNAMEPFLSHFQENPDADVLKVAAEERRQEGYAQAMTALSSARFSRIALAIAEWIDSQGWRELLDLPKRDWMSRPVGDMAQEALGRYHYQLHNIASGVGAQEPDGLRRMAEECSLLDVANGFFSDLYPEKNAEAYREALGEVRTRLQVIHYAHVSHRLFADVSKGGDAPSTHLFNGWLGAREAEYMSDFKDAWAEFAGQGIYWQA